MSPIIDLQRRLREVGRIRLGQQVATKSGSKRPSKLETFRLTSRDRAVITAAADRYGGTPEPWAAPGGEQWQVLTQSLEMPVIVPPGDMAFSQWLELWSGGGCERRCDGRTEYLGDQPCLCDPASRECRTTTRLSVMLPEVPGFGLWRVESHGYYAAAELAGVAELLGSAAAGGRMLPARLRLEQRQVKRLGQTMNFAVPVLDLDVAPDELLDIQPGRGWSPVPAELPEAPAPSITAQVAELETPPPKKPRKNAAAPLKATGLKPRTAAQVGEALGADVVAQVDGITDAQFLLATRKAATAAGWAPPTTIEEAKQLAPQLPQELAPPLTPSVVPDEVITDAVRRKLFALAGEMWPSTDDAGRRRLMLDLAEELGSPPLESRSAISLDLGTRMIEALTEMLAI